MYDSTDPAGSGRDRPAYEVGAAFPGDQLIPLTAVGQLTPADVYPCSEAIQSLREAATPLVDMDDTMGA